MFLEEADMNTNKTTPPHTANFKDLLKSSNPIVCSKSFSWCQQKMHTAIDSVDDGGSLACYHLGLVKSNSILYPI